MALSNADGNYLKVTKVDMEKNFIFFDTYKDVAVREAPSEFDAKVESYLKCGSLPSVIESFSTTGNISADIFSCGYLALKNEPPFNGASGEVWEDC